MDYKIVLDAFEGPLDLLLSLIERAKIDIYDIPINIITEQFMGYIYAMEELNLSIASEFILMASTLLEIKSKMLLPLEVAFDDNDEMEIDPRDELVRRLIEYKRYKEAAEELRISEDIESKVYYKPREDLTDYDDFDVDLKFDLKLLMKSLNNIIKRRGINDQVLDVGEIQREEYTLELCMEDIISKLKLQNKINFEAILTDNSSRSEIIAYFLSVLELIKLRQISVIQDEARMDFIIIGRNEEYIDG